jgi:DNA-binding beta-propeller fold protein YncE
MNTRHRPTRLSALCLLATLAMSAAAQDGQRTVDVRVDPVSGRVVPDDSGAGLHYWADPTRNAIVRQDPSALTDEVLTDGLNVPYGLSYDRDTQTLIWTSSGDETMQAMPLTGGEVRALNSSFEDPPVIELPYEGGKQAITVLDGAVVRVTVDAQTDARYDEVLYALPAGATTVGLALDAQTNQLYVGNAVGMAAYKIDIVSGRADTLTFTDHVAPIPDLEIDPEPEPLVNLGDVQ